MRIRGGAAVSRIVLGAGHHAVLLTTLDPRRRVRPECAGSAPNDARLHDGIARLDVEIETGAKTHVSPTARRLVPVICPHT